MDKREEIASKSGFLKDLEDDKDYDDKVVENGVAFRVPYKMIKETTFSNLSRNELIDIEHATRLQYRLMLLDAVLKARVEFVKNRIVVIYNHAGAENRKPKISVDQLIEFLAKEGVHVDRTSISTADYDYYKNIYSYQFNPPSIRETQPYGWNREEWHKMKGKYATKQEEYNQKKAEAHRRFQDEYLAEHPELAKEMGVEVKQERQGMLAKIFGKKQSKKQDKGFWFHGM